MFRCKSMYDFAWSMNFDVRYFTVLFNFKPESQKELFKLNQLSIVQRYTFYYYFNKMKIIWKPDGHSTLKFMHIIIGL